MACLSEPQAAAWLADGTLVEVLVDWSVRVAPNYLYYPSRRQMSAALRAFIDAMRD
ncbi:LysR substrate-binding domain-containing protein [uncultured Sphingomonas sp.]|uniref:LysR substrate-binding domain-containing protein n=1 Tax=uncultured Sphingomonas sp. TaxID=158754 RepID=UPI0035CA3819